MYLRLENLLPMFEIKATPCFRYQQKSTTPTLAMIKTNNS